MVSTGYLVFARLDSRRLPGKALLDLAGRPLLQRVLDRIRSAAAGRLVAVATSDREVDDPIAELAERQGVALFRGAAEDVAGRALAAAEAFRLDLFVRICGDSPFVDPQLCQRMVAQAESGSMDVVTNLFPRHYPPGCSVEVVRIEAMRRLCKQAEGQRYREHVTTYFYDNPIAFNIANCVPPIPYPPVVLTVDEPADLQRARHIVLSAGDGIDRLTLDEVVRLAAAYDSENTRAPG